MEASETIEKSINSNTFMEYHLIVSFSFLNLDFDPPIILCMCLSFTELLVSFSRDWLYRARYSAFFFGGHKHWNAGPFSSWFCMLHSCGVDSWELSICRTQLYLMLISKIDKAIKIHMISIKSTRAREKWNRTELNWRKKICISVKWLEIRLFLFFQFMKSKSYYWYTE